MKRRRRERRGRSWQLEIYSSDYITPLPELVDRSIVSCPIDTRRALYSNIVLSGGASLRPVPPFIHSHSFVHL